ncbi:hypothetical protein Acr_21g0002670 [Actinidia rufa]|uniref:Bulb-type lectin domain-containing protein n=1 Tax=Actinidia rufa TaxID=165716 RepID=A0A7J0GG33_9ERIC|nr:hypothetical protein Acr_21g0002670 [Actinidia rufa]
MVASYTLEMEHSNAPVSSSGKISLTVDGILIMDQDGNFKWSIPRLQSLVSSLQLTENGNLVLLGRFNGILWESFSCPTDTIVIGQKLPVGTLLSSAVSRGDLSIGSYRLTLGASDILLQWKNKTYWKLSMDTNAFTDSNYAVEYMAVNQTDLYLFGDNGSAVVILELMGPVDKCQIPFICGRLGLCSDAAASDNPVCSVHLTSILVPVKSGVNLSVCQDLCSGNCSCLGIFYENSSGSYYALQYELGSVMSITRSDDDRFAFIKRDLEAFSIPGLPIRFDYVELEVATDNFKTQTGAGGFGAVYKGTLPDNSLVAVKKIANCRVEKMVRMALCCVREEPPLGPNMVNVVSILEGEIPIVQPRLESLNFLHFYGR